MEGKFMGLARPAASTNGAGTLKWVPLRSEVSTIARAECRRDPGGREDHRRGGWSFRCRVLVAARRRARRVMLHARCTILLAQASTTACSSDAMKSATMPWSVQPVCALG